MNNIRWAIYRTKYILVIDFEKHCHKKINDKSLPWCFDDFKYVVIITKSAM